MLDVHLSRYRLNRCMEVATMTEWSRELIAPACNKNFFYITGGRPPGAHEFPLEFDVLVPSYARLSRSN